MIKPTLQVNDRQASVSILKNTKIILTTYNFIDGIPVTKNFENIKFQDNKEFILDFQVPPYLNSIILSISCEVYSVTKHTSVPFSFQKTFSMARSSDTHQMTDIYLRKE